jgi:hypothetical protein
MSRTAALVADCRRLTIADEETDEGVIYPVESETSVEVGVSAWLCVGKFLTEKVVDETAMRGVLAEAWQQRRGLTIRKLGGNRYSFRFYHEVDFDRIWNDGSYTFDRHLLVWDRVKPGKMLHKSFEPYEYLGSDFWYTGGMLHRERSPYVWGLHWWLYYV